MLARYVMPGEHDPEAAVEALVAILDRDDVTEAVDRWEYSPGIRENVLTKAFITEDA